MGQGDMEENEIRRDSIEGRFVVISPSRSARPGGGLTLSVPDPHGMTACPLCPKRIDKEEALFEIRGDRGGWAVKVVANKFPLVQRGYPRAYGSHELVIETPRGKHAFESFSDDEAVMVIEAFGARVATLRRDRSLRYVTVFKNVGRAAGASKAHAHSQIVATAVTPPCAVGRYKRFGAAVRHTGECPYCTMVREEVRGSRLVAETRYVVALAPFASLFPYEVWIMPRRHRHSLTALTRAERRDMASILVGVARALKGMRLDWNMVMDELFGAEEMHLALRVFPRGTVWAGMEHATGIVTNPVSPEIAAAEYRDRLS